MFFGQGISLVGSWINRVATSWLVYRLTHSSILLGWMGFGSAFMTFVFSPLAGVFADRVHHRREWIIVTQVLLMLTSAALATLSFVGRITVTQVIAVSIIKGFVLAFDMPLRQALTADIIHSRDDLANAVALNSSSVNLARLLGPSIAGLILGLTNEGYCFLFDAISYLAVVTSLFMMNSTPSSDIRRQRDSVGRQLQEGWRYIVSDPLFRNILLFFSAISLFGIPYTVLMPVIAVSVLRQGPGVLGLLLGAPGVGAMLSAFLLANRKTSKGLYALIPISAAIFGAALVAFSMARNLWVAVCFLLVIGFGMMNAMSLCSTVLQTMSTDAMRGRVMSYYIMSMTGVLPVGNLLAGWMAQRFGPEATIRWNGLIVLVVAVIFAAVRVESRIERVSEAEP